MNQDALEEHLPTSVISLSDGEYIFRIEGTKNGTYFAVSDTRPLSFCIERPTKAEAEQEARDGIASHRKFKVKGKQRTKRSAVEQAYNVDVLHAS